MPRVLSLLNFSAGMLFGISAVAVLFAAMEQDDALWPRRLLLAAAATLIAGIALKLVARPSRQHFSDAPAARRPTATGSWAATAPGDTASPRSDAAAAARRAKNVPPDPAAVRPDSRGPATADGDARRL
ncbi:MAG TPA: hypothetical protein VJQ49_13810 [Casimicrobiaceae bacterium]|nr:hypothetical protein [Casimicrobiaceae bacterium]